MLLIKNKINIILLTIVLSSCSTYIPLKRTPAQLGERTATHKELISLPKPASKIVCSVYKFRDQTGQYKNTDGVSSWSTAVTQGATSMLLKTLEDSDWFTTLEREGLPNLLNERRIISSTRDNYVGDDGKKLAPMPPMMYAGIILEGGIISYESNTVTGGFGARYFGVGGRTDYRKDQVTIYLRAVSTQNGRILKTVYTTKSILSQLVDIGIYKYVKTDRLLEIETGFSTNEPPQMCVLEAIEKAVQSLIIEGIVQNMWTLKDPEDIKSPIITNYFKEKEEAEKYVQFNSFGEKIQPGEQNSTSSVVSRKLGFGFNALTQLYEGDYNSPMLKPGGELFLRYGFSPRYSIMLNGGFGQIGDEDYFTSNMSHIDLKAIAALLPQKQFSPFLSLGVSVINFDIEDKSGKEIKREEKNMGWEPALVAGIGADYFINNRIAISASINNHFTFIDNLDGMEKGDLDDTYWSGKIGFGYYFSKFRSKKKKILISKNTKSDVENNISLGFNLTAHQYAANKSESEIKPAADFFIRYDINKWLSASFNLGGGQIAEKDIFKANIFHSDIKGSITLYQHNKWKPYLSFGFGVCNYNAEDAKGEEIERFTDNGGWESTIVSEIGTDFLINPRWSLNINLDNHYILNKELNNFTKNNNNDVYWGYRFGLVYHLSH